MRKKIEEKKSRGHYNHFILLVYHVKLFYGSFSFIEKVVRKAETKKTASLVKLSCAKWGRSWSTKWHIRVSLVRGQEWKGYAHTWISGYGYPCCLFSWIDMMSYFSVWLDR